MTKDKIFQPKNDYVFKKVFGGENNKDILIKFLRQVLKTDIRDVEILNSEITKENINDKGSILDVKAKINNNVVIDIEIQVAQTSLMPERSLYYWSKMYTEDLPSGTEYAKLGKKICINILNYNHFKTDKYHTTFKIKEDREHFNLTDMLEIHFIELPKVVEYNPEDELTAWIMFLMAETEKELDEVAKLNPAIKKAVEVVKVMSQDKKEREAYEAREKYLHDIATFKYEGKLEGKLEGKIEVVKKALKKGFDIQDITELTDLSEEEILKIQKEMSL